MKQVRIIVQSRLSSARLPAKGLLPVCGFPSLVLAAKRAANTGLDLIVATSTHVSDDQTAACLGQAGIRFVRGPLDDVLQRFVSASQDMSDDGILIRLTADNLVPDGAFLQTMLDRFLAQGVAYMGTYSPLDGLPYGLSAEIFTVEALRQAQHQATQAYEREHVTPWIAQHYGRTLFSMDGEPNRSHLRCTMDTFEDYLRICALFEGIPDPIYAPWQALCNKLAQLPDAPSCAVPFQLHQGKPHSSLTLGTVQLGLPYGRNNKTGQPATTEAIQIIRQAIGYGITQLDTARAYGESERVVGLALKDGYHGRASIITKLSPLSVLSPDTPADLVSEAVDASVFRSCRDLSVTSLDTLLLHRAQHLHEFDGAVWQRLLALRNEGVIQRLGVSVQSPQEALEALTYPEVAHIQLPFNILDWRWKESGVTELLSHKPDITVHARSALLQGILTADAACWPKLDGIQPSQWIDRLEQLRQQLNRESIADLCFAYVRAQPWITSMVVGVETLAQLHENVRLSQNPPLSKKEAVYAEQQLQGASPSLLNPALWPA